MQDPIYPNKYMGDLVCTWLAGEVLGREPSEELLSKTKSWCDYWRREHWGWGEHMSAVYSMVLLNELSAVLLFCRKMPDEIRTDFRGLFENLMAINDAFAPGPPRLSQKLFKLPIADWELADLKGLNFNVLNQIAFLRSGSRETQATGFHIYERNAVG